MASGREYNLGSLVAPFIPQLQVLAQSPLAPGASCIFCSSRAYPSFKEELDEALEDNQVGAVGKAMLTNIKFLCEFAIPTVCYAPYTIA